MSVFQIASWSSATRAGSGGGVLVVGVIGERVVRVGVTACAVGWVVDMRGGARHAVRAHRTGAALRASQASRSASNIVLMAGSSSS